MKTRKTNPRRTSKTKPSLLTKTFIIYRKYRNHKRYVHQDLL